MSGIEKSAYRGKYFNAGQESYRRCVLQRESNGHYFSISHSHSYYGGYQMSGALARGATWMMLKEHKKLLGKKRAKRVLAKLRRTPAHEWNRYWQDSAFYTILNAQHTWSGKFHWAGGRFHC